MEGLELNRSHQNSGYEHMAGLDRSWLSG